MDQRPEQQRTNNDFNEPEKYIADDVQVKGKLREKIAQRNTYNQRDENPAGERRVLEA